MKNAIVVDLDGTLLKINTFVHYIKFVCKKALRRGNVIIVGRIVLLVILRKVRLISSHEKLKKKILTCSIGYFDDNEMEELAFLLYEYENCEVVSIIEQYRNKGYLTVLSTAAPSIYAEIIGRHYKFDYVCSTKLPKGKYWQENVNEQKKLNTLKLLKDNSLVLSVFITDHYDDLPLLLVEKETNYIVNPSEKSKRIIKENRIQSQFIYGG